jgi:hypothetical protein
MFTNYGKQAVTWSLGSNLSNNYISYFNVGSGSGTALVSNTTLINEWKRFGLTGSPDFTTNRKVTFTGDLNSVQASGLILSEFGLISSGTALTGSNWTRETLGSITFDGTNELRVEYSLEVI